MTTFNEKELAERWGITTRTLQGWRSKGLGPKYIRIGERSIFYRFKDIEDYESACVVGREEPWRAPVKRAAAALDMLAKKASNQKAKDTILAIHAELCTLLE